MKLYRLWIPQVGIHGSCFDRICDKCQKKIAKEVQNKLVLPTRPSIVVTDEVTILFGYSAFGSISGVEVELCKTCNATFKKWLDANSLNISNEPIELWISNLLEKLRRNKNENKL